MIKLSSGVELSEDTVVAALKKAGISVEPRRSPTASVPKHIFKAGDVAYYGGIESLGNWRFIVSAGGKLYAIGSNGLPTGSYSQKDFEYHHYKYAGKQYDLLEK